MSEPDDGVRTWPNWTREPLVHFLAAGALVFALFAWRGDEVDPANRTIDIDRAVQADLSLRFERTLGRAPTDAELDQQIERFVRDEVLYREALRLGFDQGDAVVRRRLASKMDLAAGARAEAATPSDETLRAWYEANAERYAGAVSYSFDQLYFESESAAKSAIAGLTSGTDWSATGETISLPASAQGMPAREVDTRFGEVFLKELAKLDPGDSWQGPLRSGFGWHVVRLRARTSAAAPDFTEVRDQVLNDWRSETIASRKEAAYELLRGAYTVEIAE